MISKRLHPASFSNVNAQLAQITAIRSAYKTQYPYATFVSELTSWASYSASVLPINSGVPRIIGFISWIYKFTPFAVVGKKYKLYVKLRVNSFSVSGTQRLSMALCKYSVEAAAAFVDFKADGTIGIGPNAVKTDNIIEFTIEDTYTGLVSGNPFVQLSMSNAGATTAFSIDVLDFHINRVPTGSVVVDDGNIDGVRYADYAMQAKTADGLGTAAQATVNAAVIADILQQYDLAALSNAFAGKTWAALGDSLTATYFDVYVSYIASALGLTATNYSISGSCVAINAGTDAPNQSYVERLLGLSGNDGYSTNFDLWTILGSTNDAMKSTPVGSIGDTSNTTFYGAYNNIIQNLLGRSNHPTIVLITPMYVGYGHDVLPYRNAILALGEKYSLKVIDLYKECGINSVNHTYYLRDGAHPTQAGANLVRPYLLREFKRINLPVSTTAMPH